MKSEIEFCKDGRIFLTIDAGITPENESKLIADGWIFLNNSVILSDGAPALYFYKIVA